MKPRGAVIAVTGLAVVATAVAGAGLGAGAACVLRFRREASAFASTRPASRRGSTTRGGR